jgi:hypothetical protein
MEAMIGVELERILVDDAGYRCHNAPSSHRFRIYTAGQKQRMTPAIKREMRRRAAIERSSAVSRTNTACAATTSPMRKATPSMPSSPLPAITSVSSSNG